MSNYLLAIDIGTTSAKALAVLPTGKVLSTIQQFYPTYYPQPDFAEQDPEVISKAVNELVIQTVQTVGPGFQLDAICFSCAMHGLMAVDLAHCPLTPLMIWADTRSKKQASQIKNSETGKSIYRNTGTPIHPMSPLCKLQWLKQEQPELFQSAEKFISVKEYIIHQWTGEYCIDYSLASATGLFDIHELRWSKEALTRVGIDENKLSKPVSPQHHLNVNSLSAERFKISSKVKIIVGASDGCLAQLGSDAMNDGDMTITVGTSGAVRIASKTPKYDEQERIFTYLLDANSYVSGGATNNGAGLLQWYASHFNTSASKDLKAFVQEAESIPAGADGLIALPFLLGERAPMYNADARGVFFGVSVRHTHRHFQRAMLEGICYELKSIVDSIENVFGVQKRILVSGGIIHSDEWLQMLSDIIGKALVVSDDHDASAMGAAKLGYASLGVTMSLKGNGGKIILPDSVMKQRYEKNYSIFLRLYQQLQGLFIDHANTLN